LSVSFIVGLAACKTFPLLSAPNMNFRGDTFDVSTLKIASLLQPSGDAGWHCVDGGLLCSDCSWGAEEKIGL